MRRNLIPLTSVLLATAAWAQEAGTPDSPTPAELAEKAMKAMDALDAPASPQAGIPRAEKPAKSDTPKKKGQKGTSPAKSDEAEEGEDTTAPPLLPSATTDSARGIDLMSRARLDMMVPAGRSHRGVHYPMYRPVETDRSVLDPVAGGVAGVTAPLASLFESDVVTRIDDDHVQFDRAKWVQFDDQPAADGKERPTMSLEIERGVYDLKNEILMTNQPVKIENQQFVITGDTMLHDRASGLTRLTGRVKMTFFNEDSPTAPTPPTPAAKADPAPPLQSPRNP